MRFTSYAAASALAALATAQTFTDCNPTQKECPNDPSMPQNFETNFKAGKDAVKGWKQTAGSLAYGVDGAGFVVAQSGDAPTIQSEGFFHFGYVEVKMKAAPGVGIISSIVLQSQDLDEVDWEWIGGAEGKVQMNYFSSKNVTDYGNMIEAPIATTQSAMHTYALDWKPESLTWIIDGIPVRTLNAINANGGKNYPQTPCNVRLGNWAGGDSVNEGTREWAGGKVDYSKAPFNMTVESIKVTNYNPGTEYKWTDKTGSKESIQVIGAGNAAGAPQNSVGIQPSATASAPPLGSGIHAPSGSGTAGEFYPVTSTHSTCSENATPLASAVGGTSGFSYPTGVPKPSGNTPAGEPCECGTATATVTVIGAPPASTFTTKFPALQPSNIYSISITAPVSPLPPYPTSGILTETRPPPVVSMPLVPTGAVPYPVPTPSRNATTGAPAQFTGAASHNKAGLIVGAVVGAVLLAF
jgi:hypothetical protein